LTEPHSAIASGTSHESINQFADDIAEQRLLEKMQESGRGPENGGKNAEKFEAKEKRGVTNFPKRE
jgi:hypothetical protein